MVTEGAGTLDMSRIERALIVDHPWIGEILDNGKDWEMRSRVTRLRGAIGLIESRSGQVVGVTEIVDCHGPLSQAAVLANLHRHRIPEAMVRAGRVAKWNCAWELRSAARLVRPVRYRHPQGAVIWVTLDADTRAAIAAAGVVGVSHSQRCRSAGIVPVMGCEESGDMRIMVSDGDGRAAVAALREVVTAGSAIVAGVRAGRAVHEESRGLFAALQRHDVAIRHAWTARGPAAVALRTVAAAADALVRGAPSSACLSGPVQALARAIEIHTAIMATSVSGVATDGERSCAGGGRECAP